MTVADDGAVLVATMWADLAHRVVRRKGSTYRLRKGIPLSDFLAFMDLNEMRREIIGVGIRWKFESLKRNQNG